MGTAMVTSEFNLKSKGEEAMPGFDTSGDGGQAAAGGETTVPVEVVEKLREELKQVKDEGELLKEQVELYKANMDIKPKEEKPDTDIKDDDVITYAEAKKLIADASKGIAGTLQQLEFAQTNTDFNEVITKYLPDLLKKEPALTDAIKTSSNPALLAYKLAKSSSAYQKDAAAGQLGGEEQKAEELRAKAAKGDTDAQKLLEKMGKPGSASQAGGAGGGVSSGEFYNNMSDEDFEARIAEIQARG